MTNKELIQIELARLDKQMLIKRYCEMDGRFESTIKTSFVRGAISKKLAVDLESLTLISALFWMMPDIYETTGVKRF